MLNNRKNFILLSKYYPKTLISPVLSLKDIYSSLVDEHYLDDIYKINDVILSGNYIASPVTTANILSYKKTYNTLSALNLPFTGKTRFFLRDLLKAEQYIENVFSSFEKISILSSSDEKIFEINSLIELRLYWDTFFEKNNNIYLERGCSGDLLKIFIKDNTVISIFGVMPAHVIGDGEKNISELIETFNKGRSTNILYKHNLLKKTQGLLDDRYKPLKGEFIQLNNSLDIAMGAMYIDLSIPLKNKFNALVELLNNILLKVSYTEICCYCGDFSLGMVSPNFYIREIKQNSADIRDVYAACRTSDDIVRISDMIFTRNSENRSKLAPLFKKAEIFDSSNLNNATQFAIMKHAANRLGLKYTELSPFVYSITDLKMKKEVLFTFGMSQYTSFLARTISNDKFATKKILNKNNINTPKGMKLDIKDKRKALSLIGESEKRVWVVKPLSGSGGVGVSTGVKSCKDFEVAWGICEKMNTRAVLIEEQVSGNDYRIVVIQDSICAVTQRVAAYVIGDGEKTIRELIKIKAEERKKNPFYKLKVFEPNEIMIEFLHKKGLSLESIPNKLEKIVLLEAVNIGSGGESIDRTDEIHPGWTSIAVKARKSILNAYHVGLDLMAEDIKKSPDEQEWSIIEINTNPDLGLQLFPEIGKPRDIGKSLLLSIFGDLSYLQKRSYILTIRGKVQNVGFRKWFKSRCDVRSIKGYVRNTSEENIVEALIYGYEATLDEVIELAYRGPKKARIETVIYKKIPDEQEVVYETFTIQ